MRDAGHRTPDAGRRTSDIGHRTSDGEKSKNNISTPQGGGHNSLYGLVFKLQVILLIMESNENSIRDARTPQPREIFSTP